MAEHRSDDVLLFRLGGINCIVNLDAHHTAKGCALNDGNLLGTGTLSGAEPAQTGSLLQLARGGLWPIHLAHGETRSVVVYGA